MRPRALRTITLTPVMPASASVSRMFCDCAGACEPQPMTPTVLMLAHACGSLLNLSRPPRTMYLGRASRGGVPRERGDSRAAPHMRCWEGARSRACAQARAGAHSVSPAMDTASLVNSLVVNSGARDAGAAAAPAVTEARVAGALARATSFGRAASLGARTRVSASHSHFPTATQRKAEPGLAGARWSTERAWLMAANRAARGAHGAAACVRRDRAQQCRGGAGGRRARDALAGERRSPRGAGVLGGQRHARRAAGVHGRQHRGGP